MAALLMTYLGGSASVAWALLKIYCWGAASEAALRGAILGGALAWRGALLLIYCRGAASVAALRGFLVHFLAFLVYFWAREGSPYLAK